MAMVAAPRALSLKPINSRRAAQRASIRCQAEEVRRGYRSILL
jgi:hypothetical protein